MDTLYWVIIGIAAAILILIIVFFIHYMRNGSKDVNDYSKLRHHPQYGPLMHYESSEQKEAMSPDEEVSPDKQEALIASSIDPQDEYKFENTSFKHYGDLHKTSVPVFFPDDDDIYSGLYDGDRQQSDLDALNSEVDGITSLYEPSDEEPDNPLLSKKPTTRRRKQGRLYIRRATKNERRNRPVPPNHPFDHLPLFQD